MLKDGIIQQYGTPVDIYNEPVNTFVADFIGESNILDGQMDTDYEVTFLNRLFTCVDPRFKDARDVKIVIRPEDIDIVAPEESILSGVVESKVFKGVHYEIMVACKDYTFMVHTTDDFEIDATVGLRFGPDDIHIMRVG